MYRPIFIAGCDRSGTTMLGDQLGAAEGAFATPESQWMHEFLMLLQLRAFAAPAEAAGWLRGHFRFAVWDLSGPDVPLAELIDLNAPRATIERIVQAYLQRHHPARASSQVWVDHTPDSFKFYPLLRHYFPDARYIHIVRDGRAVFQSIKSLDWGPNNAYIGSRYWTERVQQALAVEAAEDNNCLRVRYEDILADPAQALSRLCQHADLGYSEALLEGGGLVLPGFTRGQHQLVGRRPDASRAEAWRKKLRPGEIAEFEAYAWSRQLLRSFGYPLDTPAPIKISTLTVLLRYSGDFVMYFLNRWRHRRMETRVLLESASQRGSRKQKSRAA